MAQGIVSDRHAHEVRLGLVMYGGVSLAVYINGVAHELFRAARGRGVYRLLKELCDSDVTVDVVSGASAGGVNGVLLAFALANEREFGTTAALWRQHGDIGKLLRDPDGDAFPSLLDSETVYQQALEAGFERLWQTPIEQAAEDPSPLRELDLFVTGTDYNGEITSTLDAASHTIDVKDHRALFWLKHRRGRKEQLRPDLDARGRPSSASTGAVAPGISALSTLSRLTSCFPAAFSPVVVPAAKDSDTAAERKLRLWGRLSPDRAHCFLDGGILDNKPFTTTLKTIFYRTADRPVRRHLLYVEPDPERFQIGGALRYKVPNAVESALDSLTKLPAYESIADDLRLLVEHNEKVDRMTRLRGRIVESGSEPSAEQRELWRQVRLSALRDGILRSMLGFERGERLSGARAERARELRDAFDRRFGANAPESEALLSNVDVDLRLRRLMFLSYELVDRAALASVNSAIELAEILRHALDEAFGLTVESRGDVPADTVWTLALGRARRLFSADHHGRPFPRMPPEEGAGRPLADDELSRVRVELEERLRSLASDPPREAESVLALFDRFLAACARAHGPAVEALHARHRAHDVWLFPFEHVSGAHEWDMIRVTRMSPADAQRGLCRRDMNDKVSGDALAHFGAFFKRSWRSNDILWGRLDGACQLVETLTERAWLVRTLVASATRETIFGCDREAVRAGRAVHAVLGWLETKDCLPRAGRRLRRAIAEKLAALVEAAFAGESDAREREASIAERVDSIGQALVDDLVRGAHLEILDAELPHVVEDAAAEQMEWNQLRTAERLPAGTVQASRRVAFDPTSLSFTAGQAALDPLLVTLASRRLAAQALTRLRRRDDPRPLEDYFKDFRVGAETIVGGVPRAVLLELGARAARVAEGCALESVPFAERVRASLIYRVFGHWPLLVFHRTTEFLRRAPAAQATLIVVCALYVLLAVVVNAVWWNALYSSDGLQRQLALALFVALPLALGVFAFLLVRPLRATGGFSPVRLLAGVGIGGAAVYLALLLLERRAGALCEASPSWLSDACEPLARGTILMIPLAAGILLGSLRPRRRATPEGERNG